MRRLLALGAAVALSAAGSVLTAPAAGAAACPGSSGVTVVVDFGSLGGVQVGCAAGDPSTGLSALHGAGFTTTGTRKDGPGFVCRINGAPASDPCVVTPPASAYWSYWHGAPGGGWSYSSLGAAGYNPAPGSVEGWSFGAGARPGLAPPAPPAPPPAPTPKPAPKPTVRPSTRAPVPPAPPARTAGAPPTSAPGGAPAGPRPSTSAGASSASRSAAASSGSRFPTPSAPGGTSAASTGPAAAGSGSAPPTSDPGPVPDTAEPVSSSTPVGTFALGAVLVAALGAGGFLLARRRTGQGW